MNIEIGDTIIDTNGTKWLVFDFFNQNYCVTDLLTQKINEVIEPGFIKSVDKKPTNVEYLFLKRREKALEGLEKFV
jgi:hypothetical protein